MNAAVMARRVLTLKEVDKRLERMAEDYGRGREVGGDERLIRSMRVHAFTRALFTRELPRNLPPAETPLRRKAREIVERALVAMRFEAPADDVIAALIRAADMYEAADELEQP